MDMEAYELMAAWFGSETAGSEREGE